MWHLKIETAACQKVVYDHARKSIWCSVYIWMYMYNMYMHIHIFVYVSFINVHKYIVDSPPWLSPTYHLQVETAACQKEVYHEDLLRCIYMDVYVYTCTYTHICIIHICTCVYRWYKPYCFGKLPVLQNFGRAVHYSLLKEASCVYNMYTLVYIGIDTTIGMYIYIYIYIIYICIYMYI